MRWSLMITFIVVAARPVNGGVTEFDNPEEWDAAVPETSVTIDFVFRAAQVVIEQYVEQGLLFPDGDDTAFPNSAFVNDGWGI